MVIQRALFIAIGATGDDGLNARGSQVFQDRVRIQSEAGPPDVIRTPNVWSAD
jgi:hypothetical protein